MLIQKKRQIIWVILLLATLFRLFIFWNVPLAYYTEQVFDDQLMCNYAVSLASFKWLGEYSFVTLVKTISYPLFVALCHRCMIPYSIAIGLLCVASAGVFVKAIDRCVPSFMGKAGIYLLLLYSPIGFKTLVVQRTYQLAVVPYAVIFVFSCMIAIYLRREEQEGFRGWAVGGAVSLPFFYYIRNDSIWIMPFVLTVMLVTLGSIFWKSRHITKELIRKALWVTLPVISLGVVTLGISGMNYFYYGEFVTGERTGSEFAMLMDRLYKIKDEDASTDVWCSNTAIRKAIEVSPTLKSIEKEIVYQENNWSAGTNEDMKGDMPMWVMRSALNDAGCFESASKLRLFCGKAVEELDEGFENGSLEEDGLLHLGGVQIQKEYIDNGKYWKDFKRYLLGVARYEGPVLTVWGTGVSTGDVRAIRQWEVFFKSFTTYPDVVSETGEIIKDPFALSNHKIQSCVNWNSAIFQKLSGLVNIIAVVGMIFITVILVRDRRHWELWLCIVGMVLSAVLHVIAVVFFCSWFGEEMTKFVYMYLAGAYPLLQIAKYLIIYQSIRVLVGLREMKLDMN